MTPPRRPLVSHSARRYLLGFLPRLENAACVDLANLRYIDRGHRLADVFSEDESG